MKFMDLFLKGYSKETDRYEPSSPYSASKGSVDLIASSFNKTYKTNIKIINLSNNRSYNK